MEGARETMDLELFHRFQKLAYSHAGIDLRPGKETLVAARVAKRQRSLGLSDEREYLRYLEADESGEEILHFLDAISTNFTSFFREKEHFDWLATELRRLVDAGQRRIRIWCAAAATGEEPYSLAITAREALGATAGVDVKILATDLSTRALHVARQGSYEGERLQPLSRAQLAAHFELVDGDPPRHAARPELRSLLVFKRLNLAAPPFPMAGPLDVVFCRNVMMYFDRVVRERLVQEIERLLKPDGTLIIGHAETLQGIRTELGVIAPSIYGRQAGARRRGHASSR
jgi:chemotaxis protein methyltransferase CheR